MGDNYRKSYDRSSYNTDERRKNVPEAEINKGGKGRIILIALMIIIGIVIKLWPDSAPRGEELVKKIYEWVSVQPLKYNEVK